MLGTQLVVPHLYGFAAGTGRPGLASKKGAVLSDTQGPPEQPKQMITELPPEGEKEHATQALGCRMMEHAPLLLHTINCALLASGAL
jgi:hypothetical protein